MFEVDTLESLGSVGGLVIDIIGKCGVASHRRGPYQRRRSLTGAKAAARCTQQYSISECEYTIDTGSPAAAFQG